MRHRFLGCGAPTELADQLTGDPDRPSHVGHPSPERLIICMSNGSVPSMSAMTRSADAMAAFNLTPS
jgi:hypothetical protein